MITLKQANAVYLGAEVRKFFRPNPSLDEPGGTFNGVVHRVATNVKDAAGVVWPLLFHIKYEDGDGEDITPEELDEILVDKEGVKQRRRDLLAAFATGAAGTPAGRENDENEGGPFGSGKWPGGRPAAGALGDATQRTRNMSLPGQERRSKREGKRRVDAEFEYEDQRAAKRATAGGDGAAIRARFGIRTMDPHAASAAASFASESQEVVPLAEGGMRATGLPAHLKTIEVVNFMCHENFKMDFSPHVTFVSGTNGSGKSAVLQALQCCLGVRAAVTGRAKSFHKLIRTGADEAVIRVTVYNKPYKGFDGYRHAVFGDTITVERRLSRVGGASSYLLKDQHGRIQGRKREDLDAMLQTLGLNAANPVCVMTQDTARNFLAGSSTKSDQEKFQLYMEATSLEQISYSLEVATGQVRAMNEKVEQIREDYAAMAAEHAELQKSIAALEGIQAWRDEVEGLEQVLAWAVVEGHEKAAAAAEQLLEAMPERSAAAEAAEEELRREQAALKQATEDKGHFLAAYNERATALEAEREGLKQHLREAHRAASLAQAKIKRLQDALADALGHKETLESAVREVEDEAVQATQAACEQYNRQVDAARAADDALRDEVAGQDASLREASAAAIAAHELSENLRGQCLAVGGHIERLQKQVEELRAAGRSKVANFGGRPMVELVAGLARARDQFSRPPIGPVGQHLTLEDARFALAVEAAIGLQLKAFLVHSMRDATLLRGMISRQRWQGIRPAVYVVNFDTPLHAIPPGNQPPPELATVYRVLRCGDRRLTAPILNNLVDQAHIERLALGATPEECKAAAWQTRDVAAAYAPDGSKFYRRGSTQTSIPPPHYLQYASLGVSCAQQTAGLQEEAQRAQQELAVLELQYAEARAAAVAAAAREQHARQAAGAIKKRQWEARAALTQLTQAPPPELVAGTQTECEAGSQAEIWQATQACLDLEQQLRERQAAAQAATEAKAEAESALHAKLEAIRRLNEENGAFVASYHAELQQLAAVQQRLRQAAEFAEEQRGKQGQLAATAAQLRAEQQELEEGAAQLCTREEAAAARAALEARLRAKHSEMADAELALLLTPEMLLKKVRFLEKKIAEHERAAGGSLAELQGRHAASTARMARDGRRSREAIGIFEAIDGALGLRVRKLSELDHRLEQLVNAKFRSYMWKKGHSGVIKLDRREKSLQLKVQIGSKGSKEGGAVKDLKQLSGGERSYTTVAFTLALGGHTEMPVRAMDEFDVFMDAVNRRVAMQNLFAFARENPELQFVFLTPQDIAAVEDARQACQGQGLQLPDGFIKVIAMKPPRANATQAV